MRSARAKFRIGARVTMTRMGRRWLRSGLGRPPTTDATVAGYPRAHLSVLVLRDGHLTAESYHMSFWKVTQP